MISDWVAITTTVLIVGSYIWTASFKFAEVEHRLQRLEEKVETLIMDVRSLLEKDQKTDQD